MRDRKRRKSQMIIVSKHGMPLPLTIFLSKYPSLRKVLPHMPTPIHPPLRPLSLQPHPCPSDRHPQPVLQKLTSKDPCNPNHIQRCDPQMVRFLTCYSLPSLMVTFLAAPSLSLPKSPLGSSSLRNRSVSNPIISLPKSPFPSSSPLTPVPGTRTIPAALFKRTQNRLTTPASSEFGANLSPMATNATGDPPSATISPLSLKKRPLPSSPYPQRAASSELNPTKTDQDDFT